MTLGIPTFTRAEVREILRDSGLPDDLSEANIAAIGLVSMRTQREKVLTLYYVDPSVDGIYNTLGGSIPKSSIRSYLSRAADRGQIGNDWRERRHRRPRP